jgi:phage terminase small subunit
MSAEIAADLPPKAGVPLRNAKHELVLQHYFTDPERVGYRCYIKVYPNSSVAAAKTAFSRLLKNADFAARISFLDAQVAEKAVDESVMSRREVLQELSKLGRSNVQNAIVRGDDTRDVVTSLEEMAPEHAAAIQELTVETYVEGQGDDAREVKRVRIKLHGKTPALRDLGEHYKLFTQKHEHAGEDGGAIRTVDETEPISELELARRIAFALEAGARQKPAPAKKAKGKA